MDDYYLQIRCKILFLLRHEKEVTQGEAGATLTTERFQLADQLRQALYCYSVSAAVQTEGNGGRLLFMHSHKWKKNYRLSIFFSCAQTEPLDGIKLETPIAASEQKII